MLVRYARNRATEFVQSVSVMNIYSDSSDKNLYMGGTLGQTRFLFQNRYLFQN